MSLPDQLVSIEVHIPASGAMKTKQEVDYRHAEDDQRCDRCDYYVPAERCQIVAGRIYPHGTCDLWEEGDGPGTAESDAE